MYVESVAYCKWIDCETDNVSAVCSYTTILRCIQGMPSFNAAALDKFCKFVTFSVVYFDEYINVPSIASVF